MDQSKFFDRRKNNMPAQVDPPKNDFNAKAENQDDGLLLSLRHLMTFLSSFVMGLGVGIGGMTHNSSSSFFDFSFSQRYGPFNVNIVIVLIFALLPNVVYQLLLPQAYRLKKPFLDHVFHYSSKTQVDASLVVGSILFGLGWGLSGGCPAPSAVSIVTGHPTAIATFVGIIVGTVTERLIMDSPKRTNISDYYGLAIIVSVVFFFSQWGHMLTPKVFQVNTPIIEPFGVWIQFAVGGLLVGISALLLQVMNGRVLGASGLIGRTVQFSPINQNLDAFIFTFGLFTAGLCLANVFPESLVLPNNFNVSPLVNLLGGFLTGFGTTLSGGCTSGHGVCGISRLSIRSFVAVPCFFISRIIIVTLISSMKIA